MIESYVIIGKVHPSPTYPQVSSIAPRELRAKVSNSARIATVKSDLLTELQSIAAGQRVVRRTACQLSRCTAA